jgi:hypothetical protein
VSQNLHDGQVIDSECSEICCQPATESVKPVPTKPRTVGQYVDANGNVQPVKGPSLANTVLAAALSGLFTQNVYRTGYKGAQVLDRGASIAAAGAQGMQTAEAMRAKAQANAQNLSDEQLTKKLMTITNNAKQVQLSAAMAHDKMQALDSTLDYNQKNLVDPLSEFEKNLPPGEPSIYVAKGLTADEVMATDPKTGQPAHKLTDGNVFISGKVTKPNAQGVLESEPTYSIVRNDFSVKLPEEVTQELAKFDKHFENSYQMTNGNVIIPINTYLDRIHTANELTATEDFLDRVNRQVNGDDAKPIDLAAAYKKNPALYQKAIDAATQARAAGQNREDETDDQVVRAIYSAGNGVKFLSLVGDPTKVVKWAQDADNARRRAADLKIQENAAKEAAKPITFTNALDIANNPLETPERQTRAKAVIAEKSNYDTKQKMLSAQIAAAKANTNMMTGSMPDGTQVAGTQDELTRAGATGVTKLPAADSSKVSIARQLISPNGLLTNTQKDLEAFKPEELTAIGNRWNEFEAGTLGSGDPRYIALRTDARLLSTALMQAHVGSRGSESIMEHFEGLANAGKMSGDTLRTALETERRYVEEKAMLPNSASTQPKQPTKQNQPTDPAAAFGGKTRQ